jgi:transposase-like protein
LGVPEQALRGWLKRSDIDAGRGLVGELTSTEWEEPRRLRRENHVLDRERGILKNAPARGASRRMKTGC